MIGSIIGDIVGSRFEFHNTNRMDFKLFTKDCFFTDDTICTIAIADAILSGKDYKTSLVEWCKKYYSPKRSFGGSFSRWINNPVPYYSYGNGAAMRVSPVAFAFNDLDKVLEEARKTSIVSHNHPDGIKGAQVIAKAIYMIRNNRKDANNICFDIYLQEYDSVLVPPGYFDETCQGTVPVALTWMSNSNSFEDAIRYIISRGGDSDTLAAIVGGMAEAAYGIPSYIKEDALRFLPSDMIDVIERFEETYK